MLKLEAVDITLFNFLYFVIFLFIYFFKEILAFLLGFVDTSHFLLPY